MKALKFKNLREAKHLFKKTDEVNNKLDSIDIKKLKKFMNRVDTTLENIMKRIINLELKNNADNTTTNKR